MFRRYMSGGALIELLDVLSTVKVWRLRRQLRGLRATLKKRKLILDGKSPVRLEVLVVGPGGSGSTELIEHISKYYACNSSKDIDGLKHLPAPPLLDIADKILFVHSEVETIKSSLSRRGILLIQLIKLWPHGLRLKFRDRISLECLARLQATTFEKDSRFETLFVHYNDLFESGQRISEFLGNKDGFVETFPKRRSRKSAEV
jgi:hypothetical protein